MDELYVLARSVLLDALEALGPHREACVLAGAQAIYLRVGEADLAVAPFTTDGDLGVLRGACWGDPSGSSSVILSPLPHACSDVIRLAQALSNPDPRPESPREWPFRISCPSMPAAPAAILERFASLMK